MNMYTELLLIACLTAVTCSLPGIFLLLQGTALISDAISHAILLGMVIAFLLVQSIDSGWLFFGALCAGIASVVLSQFLHEEHSIKKDAAIGLIFPLFFSIAILLINFYAYSIHLDTDAVLLGDLIFTPFQRVYIAGIDYGPQLLWWMLGLLTINSLWIFLFYKEILLYSFDPEFASTLRYAPKVFHYMFMILTTATIIKAFDTAGAIVVIGFIIIPPACAFLLSKHISYMIIHTIGISCISTLLGYILAHHTQASIPGAIAIMQGILFFCILLWKQYRK
ncbi:metal ABC transporter permease [bacterium]|nr:metal ABC transporter permease [bacterium]